MKFVLTMPPSINRTYGVTRGGKVPFYKKRVARDWEYTAGWEIKRQRMGAKLMFMGKVFVKVEYFYKREMDIDAGLKLLLDLFQKQGIYKNDKQVKRLLVIKDTQDLLKPRVEVEINEMD